MSLHEVTGHAALVEASGGSAFVRYDIPAPLEVTAWRAGGAVAVPRLTHRRRRVLLLMGGPDDVGLLVGALSARGRLADLDAVTVQRDALDAVAGLLPLGDGNDWEWMCSRSAPPVVEAEGRLVPLTTADLPEITGLLGLGNPRTDAEPVGAPAQHWVGARGDRGRLVACGVREPSVAGWPILSGITVHPDERGTGLGLAVTARLTRDGVREAGVCTLGMYSDNAVARRVYTGLGYGDIHLWSSRRLAR